MPHRTGQLLQYQIDAARPRDGFTDVVVAGQALPAARLLGLSASSSAAPINTPPTESYRRGPDLIVAYEKPGQWPVRVDCLWRAMPSGAGDQFLAAVELVVSVRTHALDSHPELAVSSAVPTNEVFRLQSLAADGWAPLCPTTAAPTTMRPDSGTGCLLFRTPHLDLSYVEMVHPADFQYDELWRDESGGDVAYITHRLFRTNLEKGVILRARVRGIFLKRSADMEIAAQCYAAFAGGDPPLAA